MQYENLVYAVNGLQLSNNEQENIIILIYASNAEIAKNYITVYQQQNQLRLQYTFLPLPLNTYFQRHADETLIEQLKTLAQDLSEQYPVLIFNPNQYLENEKSKTACLTKNEFPLRQEDEYSPFLFQSIPDSIKPYLWSEDSSGHCYAIINAEVSVWFPQRFELDDIQSACLFKGEEGKDEKKQRLIYCIYQKIILLWKSYAVKARKEKSLRMDFNSGINHLVFSSAQPLHLMSCYTISENLSICQLMMIDCSIFVFMTQ